jgi:hypothetical protein
MGMIILLMVLLGLFLKFGTGKRGRVHLKGCPQDETCTCYGDEKPKPDEG